MSTNALVAQHVTKNDLYAQLVRMGIEKGYEVIPEFRVHLSDRRKKNIDLVWVTRRPKVGFHQDLGSLQDWTLHATFEIEACDVPRKEFSRHTKDLPTINNILRTKPVHHFVVLYTAAHDRAWDKRKTNRAPADIEKRRWWARESGVKLVDGNDLSPIQLFRRATSRSA
jgi:hypothetical protein